MEQPTTANARDARPVVLVVEDDTSMRALIAQVLEPLDARVLPVNAPQHALDCLENEEVAVVVTDLRMPQVDGLEMLRFARQKSPSTLVVLITGYATVESAVRATGAPEDGRGVAVAVDGEIVPRAAWATTGLGEGQQVEVLHAVQGGC